MFAREHKYLATAVVRTRGTSFRTFSRCCARCCASGTKRQNNSISLQLWHDHNASSSSRCSESVASLSKSILGENPKLKQRDFVRRLRAAATAAGVQAPSVKEGADIWRGITGRGRKQSAEKKVAAELRKAIGNISVQGV